MQFTLTEEQRLIQDTARRIAKDVVAPRAAELDVTGEYPHDIFAAFKKGVRELPIYGGQSYERQFRGLQQGAHIIIGTPGRVMARQLAALAVTPPELPAISEPYRGATA